MRRTRWITVASAVLPVILGSLLAVQASAQMPGGVEEREVDPRTRPFILKGSPKCDDLIVECVFKIFIVVFGGDVRHLHLAQVQVRTDGSHPASACPC